MAEVKPCEQLATNETKSNFEIQSIEYKINIEFNNLSYDVPDQKRGRKSILKNINGEFRSSQLTVIMGTSGSGKTTLINLLAGYRISKTSGDININKMPQNVKLFHKMSRYILQYDHVSPHFTIMESMMFAANLKLNGHLKKWQLTAEIDKILQTLHLTNQKNTEVQNLSGGEKKRLCIAMELLNIPNVLFLDEPTTGLDEFSAMQCITMLRYLASTGRTIICSIHSPSARMFQMFNHAYVLANGECIYQGSTTNVIPYLSKINLDFPITYNPADVIIEVAAGEYGDYQQLMVNEIKNGKILNWLPVNETKRNHTRIVYLNTNVVDQFEMEVNTKKYAGTTKAWWREYGIISEKMLKQMWRDKTYLKLKIFIQLFTVFCISVVYTGIGTNAEMLIFNYHLTFLTSITFIFLSMCPMLAHIPLEMNYVRREHFNQWYRLSSYFMALVTTQIPEIFLLGTVSTATLYFSTDQPVEFNRFLLFLLVALLTSMTASSYGLAISSRLNLLNSLLLGPAIISCWVIFANHSVGNPNLTILEKALMYSGYIRHSVEGLMSALLQFNRADSICPPNVVFCLLKKPKYLFKLVGYENLNYTHSVLYLFAFYGFFNIIAYINFSCRLGSIVFLERIRFYQNLKKRFSNVTA